MAAKRKRDRSHICVNTQRDYLGAAGKQDNVEGEKAEPNAEKFKPLNVPTPLSWKPSSPLPLSALQLIYGEPSHRASVLIPHSPRSWGFVFSFSFPCLIPTGLPKFIIWPELQSGLQPFPRISLGWILGLFASKYSRRSILGSAASLKDDIGSSWCLL